MINLNKIIDCTQEFGSLRFIEGSSVGQELMNIGKWEKWLLPANCKRSFKSPKELAQCVTESNWVHNLDGKLINVISSTIIRLCNCELSWDDFGTIESTHEDDEREDDPRWIDDRRDLVHGVFLTKGRNIVMWQFTNISHCDKVIKIKETKRQENKVRWWNFWK
jgi:hypothetical protein